MKDKYGRTVDYLRVSVTDRCNLRCFYCIPKEGFTYIPHKEILRYEELLRVIKLFTRLGIKKIRITGGEPFVRKGLVFLLKEINKINGIEKLYITTNGTLLTQYMNELRGIKIDGINISLDTLDPYKFQEITGNDGLERVLQGVESALEANFRVKLNTVLMKKNIDEVTSLVTYASEKKIPIRFIELMPFNFQKEWEKEFVPQEEAFEILKKKWTLEPVEKKLGEGPSRYYYIPELDSLVGFISPLTHNFCSSCNRIRLTASGKINPCLAMPLEIDIKNPLRGGANDEELITLIKRAIYEKPLQHEMDETPPNKIMRRLGG